MDYERSKATLPTLLKALRLPTFSRFWEEIGDESDREGWGSARYLATLCEHELQARNSRRMLAHVRSSGLNVGKSLATFDFGHTPSINSCSLKSLALL